MNTPENFAPKRDLNRDLKDNNEPEDIGRRNFLKGAAAGVVAGTLAVTGINKYIEKEKTINELFSYFEGKENDFVKVNEAANMLMHEMNLANVQRVKISGTGNPNERIDILRDFLTRHLNSVSGRKYVFRDKILSFGFYTTEVLNDILGATYEITNHQNSQGSYEPLPPKDTNPQQKSPHTNKNQM